MKSRFLRLYSLIARRDATGSVRRVTKMDLSRPQTGKGFLCLLAL